MDMALKKYNNLLTSGSWSTKDLKNAHIIALVLYKPAPAEYPGATFSLL